MGNLMDTLSIIEAKDKKKVLECIESTGLGCNSWSDKTVKVVDLSSIGQGIFIYCTHSSSIPKKYTNLLESLKAPYFWRDLDGYGPDLIVDGHTSKEYSPAMKSLRIVQESGKWPFDEPKQWFVKKPLTTEEQCRWWVNKEIKVLTNSYDPEGEVGYEYVGKKTKSWVSNYYGIDYDVRDYR